MSQAGQRLDPSRYTIIPRTLSFLMRGHQVLLLRLGADRGEWAGRLNGIGGHIEACEDVLASARREIREEAGLTPGDLRLCGVVLIDAGPPGIGLFVFVGTAQGDLPQQSGPEGQAVWVDLDRLSEEATVEDLPELLPRALEGYAGKICFFAHYRYDPTGRLRILFSP